MDTDDADRFRRQAEICREELNKACNLVDAASWLQLADDFERLAAGDRPRSPPSGPHARARKVRPYIGTASTASLTDEAGFDVGKP